MLAADKAIFLIIWIDIDIKRVFNFNKYIGLPDLFEDPSLAVTQLKSLHKFQVFKWKTGFSK
jgi:hypothetical protein